jgi:hypothetical protein
MGSIQGADYSMQAALPIPRSRGKGCGYLLQDRPDRKWHGGCRSPIYGLFHALLLDNRAKKPPAQGGRNGGDSVNAYPINLRSLSDIGSAHLLALSAEEGALRPPLDLPTCNLPDGRTRTSSFAVARQSIS